MNTIHEDTRRRDHRTKCLFVRKSDQVPSQQCVVRLVWAACPLTCAVTQHYQGFLFER